MGVLRVIAKGIEFVHLRSKGFALGITLGAKGQGTAYIQSQDLALIEPLIVTMKACSIPIGSPGVYAKPTLRLLSFLFTKLADPTLFQLQPQGGNLFWLFGVEVVQRRGTGKLVESGGDEFITDMGGGVQRLDIVAAAMGILINTGRVAAQVILQERLDRGRVLRKQVSRRSHAKIGPPQRDVLALLERSSHDRLPRLIPLRYGRMLDSPFAFFRGSALIQAHDLAATPCSGLIQQICGDCHLLNFGGFATPERSLVFDLNDFDETHPGPWEWDLKRLVASFHVAATHFGFKPAAADELVWRVVSSYREHMANYAQMGSLAIRYDRLSFDRLVKHVDNPAAQHLLRQSMERAARRTHDDLLPRIAEQQGESWRLKDSPPCLFHLHGSSSLLTPEDGWMSSQEWRSLFSGVYQHYLQTISASHRQLLSYFTLQDLAFKVVGVGSVGTRCLVMLLTDAMQRPLFLQIKEARESVLAGYVPAGTLAHVHQGERVVAGQRMMKVSSDAFLGWASGPLGRHFFVRQLRDMKLTPQLELYDEPLFDIYAGICGWVLARAHARAGGMAPEIAGYIGGGDAFSEALVRYGRGYALRVEQDYELFRKACRSGRLQARSEADFSADNSI